MRAKLTIVLLAALASTSPSAHAAWADAAPRPFENGAYFELFGSKEHDSNRDNGRESGWSDSFFTEKVTLFSNGYFYHPRFLQYWLSLTGALKQENYSASFSPPTGWTKGTGFEYEGRLLFLPEHPYNFEMFAIRREPLYKEQSATQHQTVETVNGVNLRYRKKPFFSHAGFLDITTTSQTASSNVKRLNLDGEYFKEFGGGNVFSTTAFFMPSRFTSDRGLTGNSSEYGVTGLVDAHTVRLNLTATNRQFDQESPQSGSLESDQFMFQERLSAYLPAYFRMDFDYRILNNESTRTEIGGSGPIKLTDDSKDLEAIVSHRLYTSLDSRYIFLRSERTSTGGDSSSVSHTIGADYNKLIPHGRVLAGVNLGTIHTDSTGRSDVVNEPHLAIAVPGPPFALNQPNADPATLAVFVRSKIAPFEAIPLEEGVNYLVALVGNTLQVSVFLLPPPEIIGLGPYDFFVSYSLSFGSFEMRTNSYGFNTSIHLLDDMLTPYYRYLAFRSEVLSGEFPGVPLDSTSNTVGLTFQDDGWRALGEFQSLDWEFSPYRSLRAELQYTGTLEPSLRLYGTTYYLHRYYPHGTSTEAPQPYTERTIGLSGGLQQDLLTRSLTISAGASYNRVLGIVDSNAYALNSSLIWRIGKLELSAGIDAYGSDARAVTSGGQYNRSHQYYYVKVRRRIF